MPTAFKSPLFVWNTCVYVLVFFACIYFIICNTNKFYNNVSSDYGLTMKHVPSIFELCSSKLSNFYIRDCEIVSDWNSQHSFLHLEVWSRLMISPNTERWYTIMTVILLMRWLVTECTDFCILRLTSRISTAVRVWRDDNVFLLWWFIIIVWSSDQLDLGRKFQFNT